MPRLPLIHFRGRPFPGLDFGGIEETIPFTEDAAAVLLLVEAQLL